MAGHVHGVFAALFTPRAADGSVDIDVLQVHAEVLLALGVDGLVVNGASVEYLHAREGDFRRIFETVRAVTGPGRFIAGIGGPDFRRTIENGQFARDAGALSLLLPGPHFFPYEQQDVVAYVRKVADSVSAPVLLYNLPQFANGFDVSTAVDLILESGNIIGIKDSSGSLEILRALTARNNGSISRIVGNDAALVQARQEGVCDAVISGVAAALPELIRFLFHTSQVDEAHRYADAKALLDEVIVQLNRFPVPWGLKFLAEHRGMGQMGSPLPVSSARRVQADALATWLEEWWERAGKVIPLEQAVVTSPAVDR